MNAIPSADRNGDPVIQTPVVQGNVEEPLDLDVTVEHEPEPVLEEEDEDDEDDDNDEVAGVVGDPEPEDERAFINRLLREGLAGDTESWAIADEYIRHDPNEVKFMGSLGAMSREWVIEEATGTDLLSQELARRNMAGLERELLPWAHTPLKRMALDRLFSAYVAAGANDYINSVVYDGYILPGHEVDRLESLDRRFLFAFQALEAAVRLENQNKPTKPRAKPASKTADSHGVDAPGDS